MHFLILLFVYLFASGMSRWKDHWSWSCPWHCYPSLQGSSEGWGDQHKQHSINLCMVPRPCSQVVNFLKKDGSVRIFLIMFIIYTILIKMNRGSFFGCLAVMVRSFNIMYNIYVCVCHFSVENTLIWTRKKYRSILQQILLRF